MPMAWMRLYADMLNDRKVQRLNDTDFRVWVNALCIACREREGNPKTETGKVGTAEDIAWDLRANEEKVVRSLSELVKSGLIKEDEGVYYISQWRKRQYLDVEADRKRQARENTVEKKKKSVRSASAPRPKNVRSASEKCHIPEQTQNRTDTEQIRTEEFVSQNGDEKEEKRGDPRAIQKLAEAVGVQIEMPSESDAEAIKKADEKRALLRKQLAKLQAKETT